MKNMQNLNSKGSLFQEWTRIETLEQAWHKVRSNKGAAGADGVTIGLFQRNAAERLIRLQRLLRGGAYRPKPLRFVDIPKDAGGIRTLAIPTLEDRVAQTACALYLTPILDPELEDSSYAYRPGRSVQQAVRRIAHLRGEGYEWVVEGDIERFFDNIPHRRLRARLARSLTCELTLDIVDRWLEAYGLAGIGLPQGGPLSPLLANLYLDDVDEAIAASGVRLVRFGDDFVLLCKSERRAERALQEMKELLEQHHLGLHPEKTRVVPFARGFRFLGHLFVHSLVLKELDEAGEIPSADELAEAARIPPAAPEDDADAWEPEVEEDGQDRAPGLRVLYLNQQGRRLATHGEAFAVWEDTVEMAAIPHQRIDRIELGPRVAADGQAVRHALETGTELAFVNGWGEPIGSLVPQPTRHAGRHWAQARHGHDPELRLALARTLVEGRLRNQRTLLRRLNLRRKDPITAKAADRIGDLLRPAHYAQAVDEAMGVEGAAGALYWPALDRMLLHGWRLGNRQRRPPPNPVNAVISYLASMLARDVAALAQRAGLHPGFGCLHQARDGGDALAADLMEEFRAPLVEGLAVYLFNNRILKPWMFHQDREAEVCRMEPQARDAVIRGYEDWLDRPVTSQRSGHKVKWRRLIAEQAQAYADHMEDRALYRPYRMDPDRQRKTKEAGHAD